MSTYKITIPYTPKAKGSVRMGKYGCYNPSSSGMFKTREFVRKQLGTMKQPLLAGPLLVVAHYRLPAPLSAPGRKRRAQHLKPHTKKPDGDNLEKFLNDALNGILWTDDARIAWLLRSKTITDAKEGETIIFVREINDEIPDYNQILSDIMQHIRIGEENVA